MRVGAELSSEVVLHCAGKHARIAAHASIWASSHITNCNNVSTLGQCVLRITVRSVIGQLICHLSG